MTSRGAKADIEYAGIGIIYGWQFPETQKALSASAFARHTPITRAAVKSPSVPIVKCKGK